MRGSCKVTVHGIHNEEKVYIKSVTICRQWCFGISAETRQWTNERKLTHFQLKFARSTNDDILLFTPSSSSKALQIAELYTSFGQS